MPINASSLIPLLMVYDMPRSMAFYQGVLGFEVHSKYEQDGHLHWVWLKLGGAQLMLNTEFEDHERPPESKRMPVHGTTLYIGCENADAVYEHVRSKGWPAKPPETAYYGMRQLSLSDPDGFDIVFQHSVR